MTEKADHEHGPSNETAPPTVSGRRVVVVGGGNGGITTAARLLRDGFDVNVVDPRSEHVYRPLLSFVGGGRADLRAATRTQASTIPDGCRWVRDRVVGVDPAAGSVSLAGGERLSYDQLVVATGMEPDWASCPGLAEALLTDYVTTNFITDLAPKTWRLVQQLRSGTALFTLPPGPVSNGGSALKAMFMACDYWREQGRLADIEVVFVTATPSVFGVREVDETVAAAIEAYGIDVRSSSVLTSMTSSPPTAHIASEGRPDDALQFDFAHVVPPYRAPSWIADSGLSGDRAAGFVEVDPQTLQNRTWTNVWSIGDVAGTPNSKSGAAIRKQAPVLAANLGAVARGATPTERYDGYSAAPITVSRSRLSLFEFDEQYRPMPTTRWPFLNKPRRASFLFDRYGFPQIYWRRILRGKA